MSEHQSVARTGADQYGDLNARGVASRGRRGSAIFVVMMLTIALAALAGSAVLLTSGAHLVLNYHNQERDLRYGAEAALADGTSDLNNNPYTLPDTGYVQIASNATLTAADGAVVPGVVYDLFAGPTGSASKQKGRFVTLVTIAKDTARHRQFVRRVELNQESFAKYAYFSVTENGICFGSNDRLNGPVFSDDVISTCGSPQKADFMDSVFTTQTFNNGDPALDTLYKGWTKANKAINLPSTAGLAKLYTIAAGSNTEFFTPNVAADSTSQMLSRLEYAAYDLNADSDSTDAGEGFVKFYQVDLSKPLVVKPSGSWSAAQKDSVGVGYLRSGITRGHDANNCGEWRDVFNDAGVPEWEFFTIAAHHTAFYKFMIQKSNTAAFPAAVQAANNATETGSPSPDDTISMTWLAHIPARNGDASHSPRCYPGGDPHLVYTERDSTGTVMRPSTGYWNTTWSKNWPYGFRGGTDTTFTGGDVSDPTHPSRMGHWLPWPGGTPGTFTAAFKASHPDWKYLYPIDKTYNSTFRGVVAVHGSVGVSGTVNGHLTMYSDGTVGILDNLRLTNDADTSCQHLMGIVAGHNILATDNGVNAPAGDSGVRVQMRNGSSDLWVESTVMALTSWGAEGLVADPGATLVALQQPCNGQNYARGCLHVQGSIIQQGRQTVNGGNGTTTGYGYAKRYNYDNCAVVNPLPFFPTTGRFTINNYYESDPVHFSVAALFAALAP